MTSLVAPLTRRCRGNPLPLALCLLLLPYLVDARLVTRKTNKGKVQGLRTELPHMGKHVDEFYGIPYAKPPVGDLRFKHPLPADSWTGTLNATKYPNSCWQTLDTFFGNFSGATMWNANSMLSEDCLYLNVVIPHKPHHRLNKTAVMVWIYGGSFYSGTATLDIYDMKQMCAEHDIIMVSLNYRMGPFGFATVNTPDLPGNAGLFDQLMALEWVQENIHHFGGDKDNVTIFGESAGSVSVSMHLLSPLSRNKFSRAILQSGVSNAAWGTVTQEEGKSRTEELGRYLQCEAGNQAELVTCLMETDPRTLCDNQYVTAGTMQFPFVPVIDGSFFIETPEVTLRKRNFKKCPILIGTNANEGTYFLMYDASDFITLKGLQMNREQFVFTMNQVFYYYPQYPVKINSFGLEAIIFQYTNWLKPEDDLANFRGLDQAIADYHFVCQVNEFAHAYAQSGQNVYMYRFTERYSSNPWPSSLGVMHADEITFAFGLPLRPKANFTALERELSRQIMRYWTNFAKSGDPNLAPGERSLDEWPLHSTEDKEYLTLSTKYIKAEKKFEGIGNGIRSKECAFWSEYLPHLVAATRPISTVEKEWKLKFNEWSEKYIVDWKTEYEVYLKRKKQTAECDAT